MPFLQREDAHLHYEVCENALPADTLFLHGNLAANLWWEPALAHWRSQAQGLGKNPWTGRAIRLEWRGCGRSQEFTDFSLPALADDLAALAQAEGCHLPNLVAHSTGGLIALHALARHPAVFGRSFLLDPVSPEGVQFGPEMYEAFTSMSKSREVTAMVILSTIHNEHLAPDFRQRIVDAAFGVHPRIWHGVPDLIRAPGPLDLSRIGQPVCVAHGAHDKVLPLAASESLARALPQGLFRPLANQGHCANLEAPALFAEEVHQFLF